MLFLLGWMVTGVTFGQVLSEKERFEVDVAKGCAPLTVTATNLHEPITDGIVWNPTWNGDERDIEVDSDAAPETFTYEYTEPGTYRLLQVIGNATDSGPIDTLIIEVLEPLPPQFQLINCTNNSVFVDIQDTYYDRLEIDFGDDADPVTVSTSSPSFRYPYTTPGTYDVTVRGLLNDGDDTACGVSTATINTFDGPVFSEPTLSAVEVLDAQRISVAYSLPDPNVTYQLRVSENGSNSSRNYPLEPGSSFTEVEQPEWNTRSNYYCLAVVAVDPCTGNGTSSNPICTIALEAVAGELQNDLRWQTEPEMFEQYQVLRDGAGIASPTASPYEDTDVVCQETYAYQIIGSTAGGESRSETISVTAVSTTVPGALTSISASLQELSQELSVALEWAAASDAQQYYIYRSSQDGQAVRHDSLSLGSTTELSYMDSNVEIDRNYCYQLSYVDACGNESALSEPVCQRIPAQAQLYFPNAFTPNGDGLNDVFLYKASLLESVTFEVFNRWGELLFSTNQRDVGWDGTYQGGAAPQGTYLYHIRVVDQLGNEFSQRGKFVLLNTAP